MGQQSAPPPLPLVPPPPPPAVQGGTASAGGCQVRCAGCRMILTVGAGLSEFVCPSPSCKLPQMLPPELMMMMMQQQQQQQKQRTTTSQQQQQQRTNVPAHGIDPTKIQLPCAHCKAILNVPHGLSRFSCPQCGVDLAVDLSKLNQFTPTPPPPPEEEVNEVLSNFFYFYFYLLFTCYLPFAVTPYYC